MTDGGLAGSRKSSRAVRAYAASRTATSRKGNARPKRSASRTVVNAETAVPPMPTPKTPMARPRFAGGNQAFTNGTPIAKTVPPSPRNRPPSNSRGKVLPARPRNSTGRIVRRLTAGNMTRAPSLSVSAPTGMRPSDPTSTGTATSSDCWNEDSPSSSRSCPPSGLSSDQAQKLTRKPAVASPSMRFGRPPPDAASSAAPRTGASGTGGAGVGRGGVGSIPSSHAVDAQPDRAQGPGRARGSGPCALPRAAGSQAVSTVDQSAPSAARRTTVGGTHLVEDR